MVPAPIERRQRRSGGQAEECGARRAQDAHRFGKRWPPGMPQERVTGVPSASTASCASFMTNASQLASGRLSRGASHRELQIGDARGALLHGASARILQHDGIEPGDKPRPLHRPRARGTVPSNGVVRTTTRPGPPRAAGNASRPGRTSTDARPAPAAGRAAGPGNSTRHGRPRLPTRAAASA